MTVSSRLGHAVAALRRSGAVQCSGVEIAELRESSTPGSSSSSSSSERSIRPWTLSSPGRACRPSIAGPTGARSAISRSSVSSIPSILPAAAASSTARSRPALTASSIVLRARCRGPRRTPRRLLVGQRERQLLAADPKLAGGSVEAGEGDAFEELPVLEQRRRRAARTDPPPRRGRSWRRRRPGRRRSGRSRRPARPAALGAAALIGLAPSDAIGIRASDANAAAARNGRLNALVAARSIWSTMSSSSVANAASRPVGGVDRCEGGSRPRAAARRRASIPSPSARRELAPSSPAAGARRGAGRWSSPERRAAGESS